jgi:hypothetical protein
MSRYQICSGCPWWIVDNHEQGFKARIYCHLLNTMVCLGGWSSFGILLIRCWVSFRPSEVWIGLYTQQFTHMTDRGCYLKAKLGLLIDMWPSMWLQLFQTLQLCSEKVSQKYARSVRKQELPGLLRPILRMDGVSFLPYSTCQSSYRTNLNSEWWRNRASCLENDAVAVELHRRRPQRLLLHLSFFILAYNLRIW